MKRFGPDFNHVKNIYGAFDTTNFSPISREQKLDLRRKFGIDPNTTIFFYLSRNQLRKFFPQCIEAFSVFKKEYPRANAKLHFHTSFSEKSVGWDIPRLMNYYGVKKEDVLCTYICKNCGQWHVKPYDGEDKDCPYCGCKKSVITPNVQNGVLDSEMNLLYGMADASPNGFTSGGLERGIPSAMLCQLPVAVTNYSCGEDFCTLPFVHKLNFHTYYEAGSNFIKSSTDINSIKNFMTLITKMPEKEKRAIGEKSRQWAINNFSIDSIGNQWEQVFDSLIPPEWSSISLQQEQKNANYPMPTVDSDDEFIDLLYKNILKMDEPPNGSGFTFWREALKNGKSRQEVYQYFISVANNENNKNNNNKIDFGDLIDKTDKKRGLIVIPQSIGDCVMITSLFKSFHEKYPDTDLYIGTKPEYFPIFEGNKYVYKVLPYIPQMESEFIMAGVGTKRGYFDYYTNPVIQSQRQLNYLFNENILNLNY